MSGSDSVPPEKLVEMYRMMLLIREVEETLYRMSVSGLIQGFLHISVGQEAVAAGVVAALREQDYIVTTHRGHGHCLAKGLDEYRVISEILGRASGCCMGKGGSMHLCALSHGIVSANGVVGADMPIAAGLA